MKKQRPDLTGAEQMADEHWEYTKEVIEQVGEFFYKRAFVHGVKHGIEIEKNKTT